MAAPKGNQFWKLRSKHGVDKIFKEPEVLWQEACKYFEWVDKHPWMKIKTNTKVHGTEYEEVPTERPYTLSGLCVFLGVSRSWWRQFKSDRRKENDQLAHDFLTVFSKIEEIMYTQKFEGAATGSFNANIIARDLGLSEKTETEHSGSINFSHLSDDELLEKIKGVDK